jgi:hypothetical protein
MYTFISIYLIEKIGTYIFYLKDYCFNIRKRLKFINYEVNFKKILKIKLIKMTKLINKKQNRD